MFVTVQNVRDYTTLNSDSTSRYSDAQITSNIRTASEYLEKATHRYFGNRTGVTLTFTSNGDGIVDLPGFRTITSVTQAGSALTVDETYWLIPDDQQSGVYTALQLRAFTGRSPWWLSSPDWFDRNLDSPYYPANMGYGYGSLPNDVVVVGDVGYADNDLPYPLRNATVALAAWYTKRPDAVLSGASQTPDGNALDLSQIPDEVQLFIEKWRIGGHMAVSL
jgi:hypothetical protein